MLLFIITLISVGIVGSLLWRFYSSRYVLPCPSWLSWLIERDNPLAPAHKAQSIIESLEITENMNILDVGCGPGRVMLPLAEAIAPRGGHVTCLDIQLAMIEKAKQKADLLGITNVDFIHGAVGKVPLHKGYYDRILMVSVVGEIPESERLGVLSHLFEVLKPEGMVSISETMFDPHYQKRQKVIDMMQKAGFVLKKSIGSWVAYTAQFVKNPDLEKGKGNYYSQVEH